MIGPSYVSEELRRRQYGSVVRFGLLIDAGGRRAAGEAEELPRGIAELISGAIWYRVSELVRAGEGACLPDHLHELMYSAVLTYRGPEAAEAELGG